jgi:hypothetical protein
MLVQSPLKELPSYFWAQRYRASLAECHPQPGVKAAGVPGFHDGLEALLASPIGFLSRLVAVEEGTTERSHRMDGAAIVVGQEDTGTIRPASRNEGEDASLLASVKDKCSRRCQQVLKSPVVEVLARRVVLVDAFQVGRDQIAGNVVAIKRAFVTSAHRPIETEFVARRIDQRQGLPEHGGLLEGRNEKSERKKFDPSFAEVVARDGQTETDRTVLVQWSARLLAVTAWRFEGLLQARDGVDQPLAGTADLSDLARVSGIEWAVLAAMLDELLDGLLGCN